MSSMPSADRSHVRTILLAAVAGVSFCGFVEAAIPTPAGLNAGDQFRLIFVTDTLGTPLSGLASTYDAVVTGEAVAAGLDTYNGSTVNWRALVSTFTDGQSANTVLPLSETGIPILRLDGATVANDAASLWTSGPTNAPFVTPTTTLDSTAVHPVWTGSDISGGPASYTAPNFPVYSAALGSTDIKVPPETEPLYGQGYAASTSNWIGGDRARVDTGRYYAISDVITAVPEPTTLGALGVLGVLALRRKAHAS